MTSSALTLKSTDSVEMFFSLVSQGAEVILHAGQMLVRLIKSGQTSVEDLAQRYPGRFTPGFIDGLLRIGEGSLHPQLVFTPCPAHAILARSSYAVQSQALAKPVVDVIIDAETGDVLRVPLTAMSGKVAQQVVTRTGIRSREQQLMFLKRQRIGTKPAPVADPSEPWIVRKDHVEILREHTRLSKQDLLRLLAQIS